MAPRRIAVLGGGLSGLSTAYHLSRSLPRSTQITLVDASHRTGGWVDSQAIDVGFRDTDGVIREGQVVCESGPRSIRPRGSKGSPGMLRLLRDLDLVDSIIPVPFSHPAAKNRFLLDAGISAPGSFDPQLIALPSSPLAMLGRQPALLRGLLKAIASEPFKPAPTKRGTGVNDESVDSFFRRRFGHVVADNLASAMVHGIYAASSTILSVRAAFPSLWDAEQKRGSVVAGMLLGTKDKAERQAEEEERRELGSLGVESKKWSLFGLKGGLGSLTDALLKSVLEAGVEVRHSERVEELALGPAQTQSEPSASGGSAATTIHVRTSKGIIEADHLISALPPPVLASLLSPETRDGLPLATGTGTTSVDLSLPHLGANPYTSVGVVNLVYPLPPTSIHPAGFGYLIPRPSGSVSSCSSPAHRGLTSSPASSSADDAPTAPHWNTSGVLGVIFDSTAIPSSPAELEGHVTKLTLMMGGPYWSTYHPLLSPPTDPAQLIPAALEHIHAVFPHLRDVKPLLQRSSLHENCIPTYLPHHGDRLRQLHQCMTHASSPWKGRLSLVGNGYGGVGVNDCVYSAEQVVNRLARGQEATGLERWQGWA
ncbi:protoporphyrinogen oxidase [Kwoniella sp. DSM 27419]